MAALIIKGSEQAASGQGLDISSAADVHIVPSGEEHEVTVIVNLAADGDVTVKINGEATGFQESCTGKKSRIIYTGVVIGDGSTTAINVNAGATGQAWARVRKILS